MNDVSHDISVEKRAPVPKELTDQSLTSLISHVLESEGVRQKWTLAFRFATDQDIQRLHHQFMGLDSPTDIMTFPYLDSDKPMFGDFDGACVGGDIVISVDRASIQAVDADWSLLDELRFLSIHGILHLAGWDDHEPEARAAMLERQSALLNEWNTKRHAETGAIGDNRKSAGQSD